MSYDPRVCPWFEMDGSYPSDASLERLREDLRAWTPEQAVRFMFVDFVTICNRMSPYARCDLSGWPVEEPRVFAVKHDVWPLKLSFSTGGWSGAEDLIEAVLHNGMVQMMHTQWRRGGHYEFELPVSWLEQGEPQK